MHNQPEDPRDARSRTMQACARIVALILLTFGSVIAAGGTYLIAIGGTWHYALAGSVLIASAVILMHRDLEALKLYLIVWIVSLTIILWRVDFGM